jgi:hypothetical protein
MSSIQTSLPSEAEDVHRDIADDKRPSEGEELRQNLAELKIGEGCQRRNRMLGGAANLDYETYSLPVSRVCRFSKRD